MSRRRRRYLVPEVVQSSAMDCGPACLKCVLEGHGISVGYGRLREACRTDVDGSSIDTIEELAAELGLEATQMMEPKEHVLLDEAALLPAIAVVSSSGGATHFVVVWRRHGPLVQVMDPEVGRRWINVRTFRSELYRHEVVVSARSFRDWAITDGFLAPLRRRLRDLGIAAATCSRLIESCVMNPDWRALADLDAATRLGAELVEANAVRRGDEASRLLEALASGQDPNILERVATAVAAPPSAEGEEQVLLRGAVLVSIAGRRAESDESTAPSSPELAAALAEREPRPLRDLFREAKMSGVFAPLSLFVAVLSAAAVAAAEGLLWYSLLDLSDSLPPGAARFGALGAFFALLAGALLLELGILGGAAWLGRRLEAGLRLALLAKIPRLGDRYFQSRLRSDMAERSHSLQRVRNVPALLVELVKHALAIVFTAACIAGIDPASVWLAFGAAALVLFVPLGMEPRLRERDMRTRVHAGAVTRFYLDALLGVVPLRSHRAEPAMRQNHDSLALEWARSVRSSGRAAAAIDAVESAVGVGVAAWLVLAHVERSGIDGSLLLIAYWGLSLPLLGQAFAQTVRLLAAERNLVVRVTEPLGAPETESLVEPTPEARTRGKHGVALDFRAVSVLVAGHELLREIELPIPAGAHVAVVGASGAGKSTLLGLVLGFHRASRGKLCVDGMELSGAARLARLRAESVWLDPTVQLWNRSLFENVTYGSSLSERDVGAAMGAADLHDLLGSLSDGMQTRLGEGGALVSGGEGQRVRLARALAREAPRLVLLDEPFRGLDREKRAAHLARARRSWENATLLCVTHDISETLAFDRVLVLEGGRLIEDGPPETLARNDTSHYRKLLDAERSAQAALQSGDWRRLALEGGAVA